MEEPTRNQKHLCQTNKAPLNASIMVEQGGEDDLAMPMKIVT